MQELIQQNLHGKKLKELGWKVLSHSPYWSDLAPFDYHLFRLLHDHLVTTRFDDQADLKSDFEVLFSSLSKKFFEDGIVDLPKRW